MVDVHSTAKLVLLCASGKGGVRRPAGHVHLDPKSMQNKIIACKFRGFGLLVWGPGRAHVPAHVPGLSFERPLKRNRQKY